MKRSLFRIIVGLFLLAAVVLPAQDVGQIRRIMHLDGFRPTPGDVYTLTINFGINPQAGQAQRSEDVQLMLDQEYRLDVPYIGMVDATDLSYVELQERVTTEVKERVLASFVSLNLTAPAVFDVFVWGSVSRPGFHTVSSINRLIDTLAAAGRSVPPPPKCCMIRPARQVPAEIKSPGCAVVAAPGEGARSGIRNGSSEELFPMGDATHDLAIRALWIYIFNHVYPFLRVLRCKLPNGGTPSRSAFPQISCVSSI